MHSVFAAARGTSKKTAPTEGGWGAEASEATEEADLEPPAAPSPGYLGGADWQYDLGASPIPEWTAAPRRTLRKMRKVYGQQLRRPFSPPRYREFEHLPI